MDLSAPHRALQIPASARVQAEGRLAFVDATRAAMIVLVLGMHAAVTYSPFGSWYLREHPPVGPGETLFFLTFQALLQGFFMALLFFIAGCFTPGTYDRKGFRRFISDRLYRLGLPILLFALLIGPLTEYYLSGSWRTRASFVDAYQRYIITGRVFSGTGPLWFCVALMIFSLLYALLGLTGSRPRPGRVPTAASVGLTAAAMAAATFLVKTRFPSGAAVLNLQLADFPSYLIMFAAGVAAGRNGWLTRVQSSFADRTAFWCLGAAVLAWLPPLALGGALSGDTTPYEFGWHWQNAAASAWAALVCIGGSAGVLSLARRWVPSQGRIGRFMSDNAFAVYVIHPPILIALTLALRPLPLGPIEAFLLLWALTKTLAFGVAAPAVRRVPGLAGILR